MPNRKKIPMVRDIVRRYLARNKYEGLVSFRYDCGCVLDDLMPCEEPQPDCMAGYKVDCDGKCEHGDMCEWHISPHKPDSS